MNVDLQQFREDGYLILRDVVPPERLGQMRLQIELMVDREKARSAAQQANDEPPGGVWYENPQPRLTFNSVDAQTADVIDFCLGETTFGVSHQLMAAPHTALTAFGALCSGLIDYGYTDWHRDASSAEQAPLGGMQLDLVENNPGYVQWNIALYEDEVFWILPGSHRQPTTELQRRQLLSNPRAPLEGGVPARLGPGDGIVYPNLMMHWGSTYTSKLRRTIHLGYRSFGSDIFSYHHHLDWYHNDGFLKYVSAHARTHFEQQTEYYNQERDLIEATLRALITADQTAFCQRLVELHPGEKGRMVSVVLLCRIANKVITLHRPEIARMSIEARKPLIDGSPPSYYAEDIAHRFTPQDASVLEQRLAPLNERLQADAEQIHQHYSEVYTELKPEAEGPPNFESRPLRTFNHEMPAGFDVDEFVASWEK